MTGQDYNKHQIDVQFVNDLEGYSNKGYIPKDRDGNIIGNSGVTIGYGFDIGQHNAWEIEKFDIPNRIKTKLLPYVELVKEKAAQKLKNRPIWLSDSDLVLLDTEVKKKHIKGILRLMDAYKVIFHKLPSCVQTGLFSVYYNYGILGKKLMGLVKSFSYYEVAEYVRDLEFNKSRRIKEAAKIESCLGEEKDEQRQRQNGEIGI
jgi:hypothetical protein